MKPTIAAGVLIGILIGALTIMMGVTGWYKNPDRAGLFLPLAMATEIAGLLWGLRQTAQQGRTYSGQVVAGACISLIAALLVVPSSLLFTTLLYPDYIPEMARLTREAMTKAGVDDAEIEAAVTSLTPMRQAFGGFFVTLTSGIVASAVIGLWVRSRRQPEPGRQEAS